MLGRVAGVAQSAQSRHGTVFSVESSRVLEHNALRFVDHLPFDDVGPLRPVPFLVVGYFELTKLFQRHVLRQTGRAQSPPSLTSDVAKFGHDRIVYGRESDMPPNSGPFSLAATRWPWMMGRWIQRSIRIHDLHGALLVRSLRRFFRRNTRIRMSVR